MSDTTTTTTATGGELEIHSEGFKLCRGPGTTKTWKIKHVSTAGRALFEQSGDICSEDEDDPTANNHFVLEDDPDDSDSGSSSSEDEDADDINLQLDGGVRVSDDQEDSGSGKTYFITAGAAGFARGKSRLGFYFEGHRAAGDEAHPGFKRWLSLNVEELWNRDNLILQYLFKVEAILKRKGETVQELVPFETGPVVLIPYENEGERANFVLKPKIIQLPFCKPPPTRKYTRKLASANSYETNQPKGDLLLKITVTPVFKVPKEENPKVSPLCQGLKNIFNSLPSEDNFTDILLKTKDEVHLGAHKFMLAARSPFLNRLIKAETKKKGFNGTLKLPDMNSQPMRVILKWIYTDELEGDLESSVQEVLEGAVQFQLTDLMEALDKKLITFCNPDNMIRLHRIVLPRKNEMPNAFADISRMIKEYLSSLQLE